MANFTEVTSYRGMAQCDLCSDCHVNHLALMQFSPYSFYNEYCKAELEYIYATCDKCRGPTDESQSSWGFLHEGTSIRHGCLRLAYKRVGARTACGESRREYGVALDVSRITGLINHFGLVQYSRTKHASLPEAAEQMCRRGVGVVSHLM